MNIKENLWLKIIENNGNDYKYLITDMFGYVAFRTLKGFKDWMKRCNLKLSFVNSCNTTEKGTIKVYKIKGKIKEISFKSLLELPEGTIKYKDLSNGSLVDCYYRNIDGITEVYRPNPNYKEIYKPMSIEEHINYMRENG